MMGLSRESCMLGYLGIFCFCYVVGRLKYKKKTTKRASNYNEQCISTTTARFDMFKLHLNV